ncbi:MAG TPA: sodium:solute symporter [Vicinamibacterales bacterium]
MGFSGVDAVVLVVYLAGVTAFGVRFRRAHSSVAEYFVGRRRTPWWIISVSIVAAETSTLTLIGVPAIAFGTFARAEQGGSLTYLQVVAGYVVARVLLAWLFVPLFFDASRGEILTAYEVLARRFGVRVKHVVASLFLVMRPLAEGVRVFAASLVLSAVISVALPGLPHLWLWSILCVGVLTLVYTFEGGIAAVIWTDVVQLAIYIAGSLAAVYELWSLIPGGWATVLADAGRAGKLQVLSFSFDPTLPFTFWAGLAGGTCLSMASHGADQLLVQRVLACRDVRDARRALVASGVLVFGQFALFLLVGVMLFTFYRFHPLPPITTNDEIFPAFIVRQLPHGVCGLVIAAIFAAAMSNLSASLNALASSTVVDFSRPTTGGSRDERRILAMSRLMTVGWGVVLMAIAVLARGWGSVFTTGLTIASIVYGPMLGAFLLARLSTRATGGGVIAGVGTSLACMVVVRLATPLAWTWYVLVGAAICVVVGEGVSAARYQRRVGSRRAR